MSKTDGSDFRRVGAAAAEVTPPFAQTFRGRVVLMLSCVAMLSLAYAPFRLFFLAWVGLVPWLVLAAHARSKKGAFFWSWATGILFFAVNIWWIGYVTVPGAIGLMPYLGLWFALSALVLRGAGVLDVPNEASTQAWWKPALAVVVIAATWVAQEWIRGNLFTGLPWLYVGHTQSPVLAMCQVADLASVYGVTFWVVLVNAWVALFVLHRLNPARLVGAGVLVAVVVAGTLAYGLFRMGQRTTYPGPTVMVVQPNFPQSNTGEKGATPEEMVDFHVETTRAALEPLAAAGQTPDLVAWSETMMPELNPEFRSHAFRFSFRHSRLNIGEFIESTDRRLSALARDFQTGLIVGGTAQRPEGKRADGETSWVRHNSAYFYEPDGRRSALRFDKIHLVPFGEYMPFRESFPPLFRLLNLFNPYKDVDYTVQPGKELTVFPLPAKSGGGGAATTTSTAPVSRLAEYTPAGEYRFVTAICFEDVDSRLMARMFAGENGQKRADFIVNLTNDGWFAFNQMPQHLQLAVFRSIENRVPTARSVNTGVSGFIDPVGRVYDTIPVHTVGTRKAELILDRRVAPYTHIGDLFAGLCLAATGVVVAYGAWCRVKARGPAGR